MKPVNSLAVVALSLSLLHSFSANAETFRPERLVGPSTERMQHNKLFPVSKDAAPPSKLDGYLQRAAARVSTSKDGSAPGTPTLSDAQMQSIFGIMPGDANPTLQVAIKVSGTVNGDHIKRAGAKVIHSDKNGLICASVPLDALQKVASVPGVEWVRGLTTGRSPEPEGKENRSVDPPLSSKGSVNVAFNNQGLTGKGVVVAVIDSGIDWRHPDFINSDGTSRILAIYDLYDDTNARSGGQIGKPGAIMDENDKPIGTIYTNADINAALRGSLRINTEDLIGHGTACAGTAAGNGRAGGNGVRAGTYKGVAPEAELLIVRGGTTGGITNIYPHTLPWIYETCKALGKPCVVSMSFGGHYSRHDGTTGNEAILDTIFGANLPGFAACVSAGNEGRMRFHGSGTFGPKKEGQKDRFSSPLELLSYGTDLECYFDPKDDWGMLVTSGNFKTDTGKSFKIEVWSTAANGVDATLSDSDGVEIQETVDKLTPINWLRKRVAAPDASHVSITLDTGVYNIKGYGVNERVANGKFDLYAEEGRGNFAAGSDKQYMVGSPGTAKHVITVGAYDFRSDWTNLGGTKTYYNLPLGNISVYSSPGFSRDGRVKPEIAAPATYTISPLARTLKGQYAEMGEDQAKILPDGYHVAWSGTSASTPYTAGVVALMLQKNPDLTAKEVQELLIKSARKDAQTGATPNRDWGYGKLDPDFALNITAQDGFMAH